MSVIRVTPLTIERYEQDGRVGIQVSGLSRAQAAVVVRYLQSLPNMSDVSVAVIRDLIRSARRRPWRRA